MRAAASPQDKSVAAIAGVTFPSGRSPGGVDALDPLIMAPRAYNSPEQVGDVTAECVRGVFV